MISNQILTLKDFSYDLPQELIAQTPLKDRDLSRLLVRKSDGTLIHSDLKSLPNFLPKDTLLIVNDTKVFPSRLFAKNKNGANIEIFLLSKPEKKDDQILVPCFLKPAKKVQEGDFLFFEKNFKAKVIYKPAKGDMSPLILDFSDFKSELTSWLEHHAYVPLPLYIKRKEPLPWNESQDRNRYQTVYAHHEGSVAAPTAGLHFTPEIINAIQSQGVEICPITLHVGAGTFLPVKTDTISEHSMHKERYKIPPHTWEKICKARERGAPIVAVGTTSFRCVESFIRLNSHLHLLDQWLETDLFIHPEFKEDRYRSTIFSGIMTNFHQPCSTLFMLICALIGFDEAHKMYKDAVNKKYRMFSYGDSSLLWF